jgi:hypothetical protein
MRLSLPDSHFAQYDNDWSNDIASDFARNLRIPKQNNQQN